MDNKNEHLDTLHDIKQMMERSSRFISLSGLSGIAAGACALVGAWFAYREIEIFTLPYSKNRLHCPTCLKDTLISIAATVFIVAVLLAFLFTYLRSKKTKVPIWGKTAKRLLFNVCIPMIAGGIYLMKMVDHKAYGFIASGCLLFYGLALMNASKYTLIEIKYMGYAEMLLGLTSLWLPGYSLYFWAIGFGVLHILYGTLMWWKYERK